MEGVPSVRNRMSVIHSLIGMFNSNPMTPLSVFYQWDCACEVQLASTVPVFVTIFK